MNDNIITSTPTPKPKAPPQLKSEPASTFDPTKPRPVQSLAFHLPHPKLDATSNISAESRPGQRKVTITFIPLMRHHYLEITKPGCEMRDMFIHETHVASWEPLHK